MPPLTGPGESLGYILVYLLGPLLGAALTSALTAALAAYAVGLAIAVALEAFALAGLTSVLLPPKEGRHWLLRPLGMGMVLAAGAMGGLAVTVRLMLDDEGQPSHFLLPFLPALFAGLVATGCAIALLLRGLRRYRRQHGATPPEARARTALRTLGRAAARTLANLSFALAWLVLIALLFMAAQGSGQAETDVSVGDAVVAGLIVFAMMSPMASFFAWIGRRDGPAAAGAAA